MMELVTVEAVEAYQRSDQIDRMLDACSAADDELLTCQRWLREAPVKRHIYQRIYSDLLMPGAQQRCIDIGGGLTALTGQLATRHDYTLIDLFAHDDAPGLARLRQKAPFTVHLDDWYDAKIDGTFDLVVANDLFPNVDQRLELFLRRFLPVTRRLRLSLTFYPQPRFYRTKRVNSSELLCMLAWDGPQTARVLAAFADRIERCNFGLFDQPVASCYDNGRQVCLVELRGDLAGR